ncbi:MAG: DUF58 domain-containing protein [Planctomycetaceae bacterium]|nr:DUF58 domain-containing protein [Planctomycetaceae bacterium]
MLPRLRLLYVLAVAGLPFLGVPWIEWLTYVGLALTILVLVVAFVDLAISPKPFDVAVQREVGEVLSLGAENPVRVKLRNRGKRAITVELHDEPPAPSDTPDLPATAALPPGPRRVLTYHVRPHQRGDGRFGTLFLRAKSRLGFWELTAEFNEDRTIRIYPDIRSVQRTELLARQNRLAEAGVRMSKLRGRGSEFDRLREYRREDEYRGIDWKATARHTDLISREYVVERNQNVIIALDCGRGMCNALDGISHFDRTLNAAILLAYVALRQGDSVGLIAVSNKVERFVPPMRTLGSVRALVAKTYDLMPKYEATDYDLLVGELRRRFRKRSLVILCTHALDEVHLEQIVGNVRVLRSPHLVVTAFLRNVPLASRLEAVPKTDLEAFQVAAAAEIHAAQTHQLTKLTQAGVLTVDALPEDLSARLISQYLEIKARHLL